MASPSPLSAFPGLTDDLRRVEEGLVAAAQADDAFLTEVAGHLIGAGGKRQRPAFALMAACSRGGELPAGDDVVQGAVAVELVHLGSLYHDDVMDEAATRRGVESVNARWGNLKAILAGDLLLARASELAAGLGTEVAVLLAATIGRLCEGQVRELKDIYNVERTIPEYAASIGGKTAALFSTACRVGGIVAGLARDDIERLTEFGREYGMAFQIVDDVLDVVASDGEVGKPTGNDLVEGVYTLPVLRALASGSVPELRDIIGGTISPDQRDEARRLIAESGAVDWSIDHARRHAEAATSALGPLADSSAGATLVATADWLVEHVAATV